jgi:hypothetical protein
MGAKEHIKTIRSRVRQERDLISNLTSTVTDQNLRRLLRPASHLLDKVEGFFLNPQILRRIELLLHWRSGFVKPIGWFNLRHSNGNPSN